MATFQFGGHNKSQDFQGRPREVGDHALHVLCAWRITQNDKVIVGNNDLYYPADYDYDGKNIPEEFDWDRSPNRRDRLLAELFQGGQREFVVQGIEVQAGGALHVTLSSGLSLDVFPNDSLAQEHWRIFRPDGEEKHFVVTGQGLEA